MRWKIRIREPNPSFARIILANKEWDGKYKNAKKLLKELCKKWPKNRKVKFLMTCGGFIVFPWPKSLSRDIGEDNLFPSKKAVNSLVEEAEKCVKCVLKGLDRKLRKFADYITLGIDSHMEMGKKSLPHIELVFLVDLRKPNKLYWTGKSYPTCDQQKGLVKIENLKTHFVKLDVGKVMILGCHDLNIFNPRSQKNAKGWRKKINRDFRKLAKRKKPVYVLHHPHTTVKVRTWLNAWKRLRTELPSVEQYAGAGRYYDSKCKRSEWDDLDKVLESTRMGSTIDFVVGVPYRR